MLNLQSFTYRAVLADLFSRWMVNRPEPEDVWRLKQIVNFNSYIARIWVDCLVRGALTELYGGVAIQSFVAKTKGQLKDFVVGNLAYTNHRIEELVAHYRECPEEFYRETPFDGRVYHTLDGGPRICVAATRLKRFRRIGEKGARRIVDYLMERIRRTADGFADSRARRLGTARHRMLTPLPEMEIEFHASERRVIEGIRRGTIHSALPVLPIPDVVGVKLVAEPHEMQRVISGLAALPDCQLVEVEEHTGAYEAFNLHISYRIPKDLLSARPPDERSLRVLAGRGFDPARVPDLYETFLAGAEDHVLLEVIVSTFENVLEAEIGRSMHEERVLAQRSGSDYHSPLARNVRYIMDYMLSLCIAPGVEPVDDVPIKLWVNYMPDRMDDLIRGMFDVPSDSSFDSDLMPNGRMISEI